ncbi:transporter [Caulobacter segnis]|uniref:Transporter n=1 Tax=Caulobacter segnis TaxID=88688 RepID=A0A2W5V403_9CAUL|nr:transporter [Caulobacter segnis]PZR34032.1 MAG: transporter [Caulobacter segnis]
MTRALAIAIGLLAIAGAARAEEREFCVDRPGKGSPPCVLDKGRFQVEIGGADAAFTRGGGVSIDDVSYGALELRLGLASTLEGQMSWTPRERVRTRDHGSASTVSGAGDLTFGLLQSLKNPDGDGLAIAVGASVTAPTGAKGISDGKWQGGLIAPVSVPLSADWSLSLTPQVAARPNESGDGRHAGYALAAGVDRAVGPVNLGVELWVDVDDDPAGRVTQASFDLSAAWTPKTLKDVQFDVSAYVGLNRKTPDLELDFGFAHRF